MYANHTNQVVAQPANKKNRLLAVERFFVLFQSKKVWLQLAMLIGFMFLLIAPLYTPLPKSSDTVYSNLRLSTQFIFWGIWYGGCLLSVIPFARLWCGFFCPLGALSEWVGKFSLQLKLPKFIRWEGWLLFMFIIVTILGQTLDVRNDHRGLFILFAYMFICAIILGLLFSKNNNRPWCRYFCPIGKILGVVSRLSMIEFRSQNKIFELSNPNDYYKNGTLCPTNYNLPYKNDTSNCIACGKCTFARQKAGLGLYKRSPNQELLNIEKSKPNLYEIIFIYLCPGLSAGGFLWTILPNYNSFREKIGTYFLTHQQLGWFNNSSIFLGSHTWNQQYNWLDVFSITVYMLGYAGNVALVSLAFLSLASLILSSSKKTRKQTLRNISYGSIPIAILSVVIGLCNNFFTTLNKDFHISLTATTALQCLLFILAGAWTLILNYKMINKLSIQNKIKKYTGFSFIVCNVLFLTYIWHPVFFNSTYLSDVEKIRQHIVVPSL